MNKKKEFIELGFESQNSKLREKDLSSFYEIS